MSPEPDKYTYPNGVLRNNLGITDGKTLEPALNSFATRRMHGVLLDGLPERPDFEYLRSIHHRLFQDTLPFAGRIRDVDAQAEGVLAYCRPDFIRPELDRLYRQLESTDYLRGMDKPEFSAELAERWGDLTMIHPFRDGNTRSQSLYIDALSARAGYQVEWSRANVDDLRAARLHAAAGNSHYLKNWISDHTRPISSDETLSDVFARSRLAFSDRSPTQQTSRTSAAGGGAAKGTRTAGRQDRGGRS